METAPPIIFSRRKAAAKWARARSRRDRPGAGCFLLDALVDDVIERLSFIRLRPSQALVVGDPSSRLAQHLHEDGAKLAIGRLGEFDEERPAEAGGFDLIVHLMGLGHVNDLPGALVHARGALASGGLFLAAFPGAGSLPLLRGIALAADGDRPAARMHPMVDIRAGSGLLQRAGFARQVTDSFALNVRYSSLDRLVGDLRDHGLTRSLAEPSPPFTRAACERALAAFDAERDEQGKATERFEILVLSGWKD